MSPEVYGHALVVDDREEVDFRRSRYQVGYFPKLLPSLTAEWLEHVSPIPGVIGSNPEVFRCDNRKGYVGGWTCLSRVLHGVGLLSVLILLYSKNSTKRPKTVPI